ncbi:hypothetical protein HK096_007993, partial [Nowakowskiella sp. JEL0078]
MQNELQNESETSVTNSSILNSTIFPVISNPDMVPVLSAGQSAMPPLMPVEPHINPHVNTIQRTLSAHIPLNYDSEVKRRNETASNMNQNAPVSPLLSPNSLSPNNLEQLRYFEQDGKNPQEELGYKTFWHRIRSSKSVTELQKDKKPDSFFKLGGPISIKRSSSRTKSFYGNNPNPKSLNTGETIIRRFNSETFHVKSSQTTTARSASFEPPPAITEQNISRIYQNYSDTAIDSIQNSPNTSPVIPYLGYEHFNDTKSSSNDQRRQTPEPTTQFISDTRRMRSQSVVSDTRYSIQRNNLGGDKHLMNVGLIAESVMINIPTAEFLPPEVMKDKIDYTKMDPLDIALLLHRNDMPGVKKSEISLIIGKGDDFHTRVLAHYLDCFNFSGQSLDDAFRRFCNHLYLTGETHQIDRILFQFSRRYWECNLHSRNMFLSIDIVYVILFSLVLLNTDLHAVNPSANRRMSKKVFVQNTLDSVENIISNDSVKYPPMSQIWKRDMKSLLK